MDKDMISLNEHEVSKILMAHSSEVPSDLQAAIAVSVQPYVESLVRIAPHVKEILDRDIQKALEDGSFGELAKDAKNLLKQVKKARISLDKDRTKVKEPYLKAGRAIDGTVKEIRDVMKTAEEGLDGVANYLAYERKRENERRFLSRSKRIQEEGGNEFAYGDSLGTMSDDDFDILIKGLQAQAEEKVQEKLRQVKYQERVQELFPYNLATWALSELTAHTTDKEYADLLERAQADQDRLSAAIIAKEKQEREEREAREAELAAQRRAAQEAEAQRRQAERALQEEQQAREAELAAQRRAAQEAEAQRKAQPELARIKKLRGYIVDHISEFSDAGCVDLLRRIQRNIDIFLEGRS